MALSMMPLMLQVALAGQVWADCSSEMDCSLGGVCVSGKCRCDATFSGPTCAQLNLLPAKKTPLIDIGTESASWGGVPVYDPSDKKWHLFYAECDHSRQRPVCTLICRPSAHRLKDWRLRPAQV